MAKTLKIFGPPGTGKTFTLLELFENELKTVEPKRIGFMTFTRAARAEVLSRTKLPEDELPYVKTIHATCYKELKIDQNQLVMTRDVREFGTKIGVQLSGFMPDLFSLESVTEKFQQPTKADRLLQLNHLGRHRGLKLRDTLREAPLELDYNYARWFTQAYRDWKTSIGKMDYTDLLTTYLADKEPLDLDVLFVDEAQDLSWLQWEVVHKFGRNCERIYLAGDDDQAIFTWAGASSSMFNLEPCDEIRVLPQSYRLPRIVHDLSQKIIHRIKVRQEKEFRPRASEGEYRPIGLLDTQHLSQGTSLVLYRNFHRGASLSEQLEGLGIPFMGANATLSNPDVQLVLQGLSKILKHEPLTMSEAKAMVHHANPLALTENVKELVSHKVGELSATAIFNDLVKFERIELHKILPKLPRIAYLQRVLTKAGLKEALNPKVTLLSIHQSKGREADTVVLDMELARRTYEAYMKEPDEEHRVYYVGVTRTKQRLLTLLPTESMAYVI